MRKFPWSPTSSSQWRHYPPRSLPSRGERVCYHRAGRRAIQVVAASMRSDRESPIPVADVDGAPALSSRQAFLRVFPGVMVAMFLAAADQTILASALPTIASSLGGFADLSWVVVAYLLTATIGAPLYGHLGDRFGRRRMLLGRPRYLHRSVAGVRARADAADAHRRACAAGPRRRRVDDAGAVAHRRARLAARTGPLLRLLRHRVRAREHVGAGAGRVSHRALQLARSVPHQSAAGADRRSAGVAHSADADARPRRVSSRLRSARCCFARPRRRCCSCCRREGIVSRGHRRHCSH